MTTTVPTIPVLPSRHADEAPIQTRQPKSQSGRDESRPFYTRDEQDKTWQNLQAMFGRELKELTDLVGEEQAKGLVLGRYERVHQWVTLMINLIEFDVGISGVAVRNSDKKLEAIRIATIAQAQKARDQFCADYADASNRPGNGIPVSEAGMGRAKRTMLFSWMARIDSRLCMKNKDGQLVPNSDIERILMGSREVTNEERQSWFQMVSDYLFFFQNIKFLVFKHWEKMVKEAGEAATDEQTKAMAEAKGAYEAYKNALMSFKKQMFAAGQEDRVSWLKMMIEDKRTSPADKAEYTKQLAKLRGEKAPEEEETDTETDSATGTEG